MPCTKLGRLVQQVGYMQDEALLSSLHGSCPFKSIPPDTSDYTSRFDISAGNH